MARFPLLNFLPAVFSLFSFALILVVLLAGVNNTLSNVFFLKTDTTNLKVPPKLGNSTFLAGLSAVSGTDFVGQDATAASLGLANTYTIGVLAVCGHFADGSVSCSRPQFNFWFNPATDLRLDSTSLQGNYPPGYLSAISDYSRLNRFLPGAYVTSALFVWAASLAACCSAALAAVVSVIATVVLLAASIGGIVIFKHLNDAINGNFAASGLSSSLGSIPTALSFVAFAFALLSSIVYVIRARDESSGRGRRRGGGGVEARSVGGPESGYGPAGPATAIPGEKPSGARGLLSRLPLVGGMGQQRYTQIEKQQDAASQKEPMLAAAGGSPDGIRPKRLEEDWAAPDDFSANNNSNNGSGQPGARSAAPPGIPFLSLGGNKPVKDLNTAYEPYSSTTTGTAQ
ncbi:SUR7/PalI family-domain-containing protein [Lasiosphaeria miniovina]|uniref:SUR7/PalI family-domain-containing protein n=1 Tax=Lasiosphaeria miniovina TaxID=1954250 RepID=A0AA40E1M5_9PEZI|nr:SUR7/PalI family-domain-containing protein [Lasiosphaeria miniovina]KAK0721627.1 SUR7/PalI family-domain-containing protein [Lasiosphaeria miniovina]